MADSRPELRIAVLYGGRSAEHDVSVLSATNVLRALDPQRYEAVPVFVTRDGRWLLSRFADDRPGTSSKGTELCLLPGGCGKALAIPPNGAPYPLPDIDILFPVLHGLHGEDGSVQGLAEVARVPLAGCGILGSAAALDKAVTKRLLTSAGVPVARAVTITQKTVPAFADLRTALGLPLFVKPARQGSSVGVSRVGDEVEYDAGLAEGFRYDSVLLAEEFVRGREVECAVLEDADGSLFVSRPGEIVPAESHGFYSYDAKYVDEAGALLKAPADLSPATEDAIRDTARKAFRALGCDGMARVDFFVAEDGRHLVNEVNTIPGFTDISMCSRAMEASGVDYGQIIDRLVAHGLAREERMAPR